MDSWLRARRSLSRRPPALYLPDCHMLPGFLSGPRGHCGRTEGDRARARGEAVRAELAVGGPQDADALHPQVSSSVTLSEVVFQLGRMVDCERSGRNVTCRV